MKIQHKGITIYNLHTFPFTDILTTIPGAPDSYFFCQHRSLNQTMYILVSELVRKRQKINLFTKSYP